ncbi:MAG: purine-binding chemotaxis protein CheW [Deltaproteobacteria bacterium]|nr:purine-binding chemotaxis protein CheW [Deltaproteobacteria bacterium]
MVEGVSDWDAESGSLLIATFRLNQSLFGVDSTLVQEVVLMGEIRGVHHAPGYVAGIRNLRGRIVTVVDLGVKLGLGGVVRGPEARILIVDWEGEPVGLLVDTVDETIALGETALEPPPPNLHGTQQRVLQGVCRNGGSLVGLLDLGAVLGTGEPAAPAA